jgi:hypothetical protein
MSQSYEVGDILYLVSNKQRQVLPVRVEEQLNRRTLDGESVTYRVRGPGAERTVDLAGLVETGDIYRTLEDARKALCDKAMRAIDQVLQDAQQLAQEHFSSTNNENIPTEAQPDETPALEPEPAKGGRRFKKPAKDEDKGDWPTLSVVLPDGTRAKLANSGV